MRNGREVRCVRLDEQTIRRSETEQRVVIPFLECDHSRERQHPTRVERSLSQLAWSGEAVHDAADAEPPCSLDQRARIGDCFAAVNDEWPAQLTCQFDLRLECGPLLV